MLWIRILGLVNLVVWAFWVWTGVGLSRGVVDQHVPGYPSAEQIEYYIGIPALMIAVCLGFVALTFFGKGRLTSNTAAVVLVAALFAVLPFMFFYGGGV